LVYTWSDTQPTLCPNDHSNRSNIQNIGISDTIEQNTVSIEQNVTSNYQTTTLVVPIPVMTIGDVHIHDITWPIDIYVENGISSITKLFRG